MDKIILSQEDQSALLVHQKFCSKLVELGKKFKGQKAPPEFQEILKSIGWLEKLYPNVEGYIKHDKRYVLEHTLFVLTVDERITIGIDIRHILDYITLNEDQTKIRKSIISKLT